MGMTRSCATRIGPGRPHVTTSPRRARPRRRGPIRRWAAWLTVGVLVGTIVLVAAWASVNWLYQTYRKPTELFFPVSGALTKTPPQTWREYGPLFRKHSTAVISPELLAALAQVEGSGNPVARTYWRWSLTGTPFEWYRPASSAVGMYQITDAAFLEARRYCIHDHVVVKDGPWHDVDSCWFNSLYARVVPSHAIELTAAMLDRAVAASVGRHRSPPATLQQKQRLAAIIHLCGAGAGEAYVRHGFRLIPGQRCGDHDAGNYLVKISSMQRQFARLSAAG